MAHANHWLIFGLLAVAILVAFLWDSLIEGTIRHRRSEFVGLTYLFVLGVVLAEGSIYLDDVRIHPLLSAAVASVFLLLYFASAVFVWKKLKLDEKPTRGARRKII
jgi:hypothetical protein